MLLHVVSRMILLIVMLLRRRKQAEAECSGYDDGFYQ
jgi:hypothetical protein